MQREFSICPFGAFRRYGEGPMTVSVPAGATVAELRTAFAATLQDDAARKLLACSALATDDALLNESEPLPESAELVVLPPVSGG